jgi:phosphoribosyl 1,2-cyclic phosphate phosphodiesterase
MKLTYLGTAAAEGFPAVFCNCDYCREARMYKGKNIRTRSQSMINDDLLIDLPADTYYHFLQNGIEGDKIKYLLVTHAHSDHFYYKELETREKPFAHKMRSENLEIFCSKSVYEVIDSQGVPKNTTVTLVNPFETVNVGKYTVTGLPARHAGGKGALIYLIKADKTLLYAHDTGFFYDEVFDYIKTNKIVFDMVSFDCTNVDIKISDEGSHMGIDNIERAIKRFTELGAITPDTILYINHFSHNANPLHHVLEERVKNIKLGVSYDGLTVDI